MAVGLQRVVADGELAYAIKALNEKGTVRSGDALTLGIGAMTDARWARFHHSMVEVGALPKGIDPRKAYSLEFVNKGVGKT
jgi:NitT/TauT family transport system substrate-binding protein